MKMKVRLFTAGQVHYEIVYGVDYEQGRKVALQRHPFSTVLDITSVFRWFAPTRMPCKVPVIILVYVYNLIIDARVDVTGICL